MQQDILRVRQGFVKQQREIINKEKLAKEKRIQEAVDKCYDGIVDLIMHDITHKTNADDIFKDKSKFELNYHLPNLKEKYFSYMELYKDKFEYDFGIRWYLYFRILIDND